MNFNHQQWWDPEGPMQTLHHMQSARMQWIQSHVLWNDSRVLDIGCGGGLLSESMAHAGAHVTGIDLSKQAIQCAITHAQTHHLSIEYICISAHDWALLHENHYDFITCLEVLEHVAQPEHLIQSCAAMLKPDGLLFVSTLNRSWMSYVKMVLCAEHLLRWIPKGTHRYDFFLKPSELAALGRIYGLEAQSTVGFLYGLRSRQVTLCHDGRLDHYGMVLRKRSHEITETI